MNWLIKEEPVRRSPPGLEWRLFKLLPWILAAGLVLLAAGAMLARLLISGGPAWQVEAAVREVDYALVGALLIFIDLLIVAAIGCVIVLIMKGPHYSADSYELPPAERPTERDSRPP